MHNKVAALTVVKDEGAYIVDWINHCLYFGFAEVYIAVNRTTDNTMQLLEEIAKQNSRVKLYCTDWIDSFPNKDGINMHLQYYSFCFLINEALKNSELTHFFPLDADEFWFPNNFEMSIGAYIKSLPHFDMLSVPWAAQSGDSEPFMLPFQNEEYTLKDNVKSLLSRSAASNIKKYQLHIPEINNPKLIHLNVSGEPAKRVNKKSQRIKFDSRLVMSSMILHRMIRSEEEYLALLLRQRPSSTLPIKNNRQGFTREFESTLNIAQGVKDKYEEYLVSNRSCYKPFIIDAEQDIINKISLYQFIPIEVITLNIKEFIKVLKGTKELPIILDRCLNADLNDEELEAIAESLDKTNKVYSLKFLNKTSSVKKRGFGKKLLNRIMR